MKTSIIIAGIVGILLVVAGIYYFNSGNEAIVMSLNETSITPGENTSTAVEGNVTPPVKVDFEVQIVGFAFSPSDLRVKVGQTVKWTNYDNLQHTVTSDSVNELDSPVLAKGQSYTHTFKKDGVFEYHCLLHPSMRAKVIAN